MKQRALEQRAMEQRALEQRAMGDGADVEGGELPGGHSVPPKRIPFQKLGSGLTKLLTLRANPAREGLTQLHGAPAQALNAALGPERGCPDKTRTQRSTHTAPHREHTPSS